MAQDFLVDKFCHLWHVSRQQIFEENFSVYAKLETCFLSQTETRCSNTVLNSLENQHLQQGMVKSLNYHHIVEEAKDMSEGQEKVEESDSSNWGSHSVSP